MSTNIENMDNYQINDKNPFNQRFPKKKFRSFTNCITQSHLIMQWEDKKCNRYLILLRGQQLSRAYLDRVMLQLYTAEFMISGKS